MKAKISIPARQADKEKWVIALENHLRAIDDKLNGEMSIQERREAVIIHDILFDVYSEIIDFSTIKNTSK